MARLAIFPIVWPALLLLFYGMGTMLDLSRTNQDLAKQLYQAKQRLESLRALEVASRISSQEYQRLLNDFAQLTGLQASDPFRSPELKTRASTSVALLVAGLTQDIYRDHLSSDDPEYLEFQPVSLVGQEHLGPFVITEFALHIRGRYGAIYVLLKKLAQLLSLRKLVISIGILQVARSDEVSASGAPILVITLPVRAYFRD